MERLKIDGGLDTHSVSFYPLYSEIVCHTVVRKKGRARAVVMVNLEVEIDGKKYETQTHIRVPLKLAK